MCVWSCCIFFFFKQKTAYEMRISDWSSDVCSSDLRDDLDPAVLEGAATGGIDILPGDHPGGNFPGGGHHPGGQAEPQPAIEYDPNRLFRRQAGQPAGQLRVILQCGIDRKSTRLTPVTNAHLVCRLLLEKKNTTKN